MHKNNFEKIADQLALCAVTRDTTKIGHIKQAAGFLENPTNRYLLGGLGGAGLGALVGYTQPDKSKRKRNALYYGALGGLGGLGLAHLYNSAGAGKKEDAAGTGGANSAPQKPKGPDWRPVGGRRPPGAQIRDPNPAPQAPGTPVAESTENLQTPADAASAPAYISKEMYDALPIELREKAVAGLDEAIVNGQTVTRQNYSFPRNSPEYVAAQILAQPNPDGKGYRALSAQDLLPTYAGNFEPGQTHSYLHHNLLDWSQPGGSTAFPTAEDAYLQTGRASGLNYLTTTQDTTRPALHKKIIEAVRAAAADPERKDLPNFGFSLSSERAPLGPGGGGDSPLYRSLRQHNVIPAAAGDHFVHSGFNVNNPETLSLLNRLRNLYATDPTTGKTMTAYDVAVRQGITSPEALQEFLKKTQDPAAASVRAWTGGGSGGHNEFF